MKRLIFALLVFSIIISSFSLASATLQDACRNDLLAYYTLDTSTIVPTSQTQQSSVVYDTPENYVGQGSLISTTVPGITGESAGFAGRTDTWIRLPTDLLNDREIFTISFWMKSTGTSDGLFSVASSQSGHGSNEFLIWNQENLLLTWHSGTLNPSGTVKLNDDKWHQIAVTIDSQSGKLQLYLDGTFKNEFTINNIPIIANHIVVGQDQDGVGNYGGVYPNPYFGFIDDLVVFNRVLTPEEINDIFIQGTQPQPLGACQEIPPQCGDGNPNPPEEECDTGPANSDTTPDACRTNCKNARCGDGVIDSGEACEPPNSANCDANCQIPAISTGEISEVFWTDMADTQITESYVGRTVKLVAETTFIAGTTINFEINEDDSPLGSQNIRQGLNAQTDVNGIAVLQWKITDTDMTAAGIGGLEGNIAEFFFKAFKNAQSKNSENLNVQNIEGPNNPPEAIISNPIHRQIYYTNVPIQFNHDSFDVESPITSFEWTTDTNTKITQDSFTHTYTTPGQKTITLKVTDEQGLSDEDQIAILVLDSPGILAFIEQPFHKQVIKDTDLIIDFSAADSYVVKSTTDSSCSTTLECLAGNCPTKTQNSPSCATSTSAQIDVTGGSKSFDQTTFTWNFDDGSSTSGPGKTSGRKGYSSEGNKVINLLLNYPALNLQQTFRREFSLVGVRQCIDNGNTFIELNQEGIEIARFSTSNSDACAGPDRLTGIIEGIDYRRDDCCPAGWLCSNDLNNPGCFLPDPIIDRCEKYLTAQDCTDDLYQVPKQQYPLWSQWKCGTTQQTTNTLCKCVWDTTNFATDKCVFGKKINTIFDPTPKSDCRLEIVSESECIDGSKTVEVKARQVLGTIQDDTLCKDNTYNLLCGRPSVKLPFFTSSNFILSLLSIALIYYLMFLRKTRKNPQ